MPDDRFETAIADALRPYRDTIALLDDLQAERRYIYEFVLLVCARLDALANVGQGVRTRDNFVRFVTRYGVHRREFAQVSVPDLAAQLVGYLWVLPGTIPQPGRLQLLTENDAPLIDVIERSDLPITEEHITAFLSFILAALQATFRIRPGQSKRKQSMASAGDVLATARSYAASYKRGRYVRAVRAIEPLVRDASVARRLYRDYRSAAIHEHGFEVDEEGFFRRESMYWRTVYRHPSTELPPGLELQFPATCLRETLSSCLDSYQRDLFHRRKVPLSLFLDLFDLDDAEYLDDATIPEGRTVHYSSRRRS
jgi:hypothetical protein